MEEPLFMFQLIIAVDVSEHRSIYNKLNAPCSGDFNSSDLDRRLAVNKMATNLWCYFTLRMRDHPWRVSIRLANICSILSSINIYPLLNTVLKNPCYEFLIVLIFIHEAQVWNPAWILPFNIAVSTPFYTSRMIFNAVLGACFKTKLLRWKSSSSKIIAKPLNVKAINTNIGPSMQLSKYKCIWISNNYWTINTVSGKKLLELWSKWIILSILYIFNIKTTTIQNFHLHKKKPFTSTAHGK